jgi:mannose-1-phosphate guanylyltransferase
MEEITMTRSPSYNHSTLWSIILAGNESSALDPFIALWQGSSVPKQFCTFVGTRSLLQHTWDRADQFSHPESKMTVVTQPYLQHTCRQLGGRVPGLIATEPFQLGSLSSALLGLAAVRAQDPESIIVLYPSQSFIHPEHHFLRTIQRAMWAARLLNDRVILLGASSDFSVGRYGWLQSKGKLGWASGLPVHAIEMSGTSAFPANTTNDPSHSPPEIFFNSGIVLAKTETLWNRCKSLFPGIIHQLESLGNLTGRPENQKQKALAFQQMPPGCFWKDFLHQMPQYLAMVEMKGCTWSDWEDPGHIADTLALLGKKPAFPIEWNMNHLDGQPSSNTIQEVKT